MRAADDLTSGSFSATRQFTVDTAAPVVSSITNAGASPTNASSVAWTVTFSKPVTGVAESNFGLVNTALGGTPTITNLSGSGATYTVTASTGTGTGSLGLNLTGVGSIKDLAGNSLTVSLPVVGQVYAIDRTNPTAVITFPTDGGSYNAAGFAAGCATVGVCGTAADAGGAGLSGVAVTVQRLSDSQYWNGSTWVGGQQSLTATGTSAWSLGLATANLTDDTSYLVTAQATDGVGNTSTVANATFTYDTVGPAVSLTTPADGAVLNTATPALSGAAGNGVGDLPTVTVTIYQGVGTGGAVVQAIPVTRSGASWSTNATALADGTYTTQATQSDTAGNTGTSTANTFTVDTTAPAVTLTAPADGSTTTNTTPTFSGAAGTASGDAATVNVNVYAGGTATGSPVQTLSTSVSAGTFTVDALSALTPGTYTAVAQQTDVAGNTGSSTANTFTVVPTVTSVSPSSITRGDSHQSVTVNGSNFASGAVVALSGTGVTVHSTSFVSSTELTVDVSVAGSAPLGGRDVTVTNNAGGSATLPGALTVLAAPLDHLVLTPSSGAIGAGSSQGYTAEGFDAFGNSYGDVTASTTFTISPDGSCTATNCTATVAGPHTVTGTYSGKTGTASLTVNAGPLNYLVVTPDTTHVTAGTSQPFTAEGFDLYANDLGDVTASTTFAIAPDGSCAGASCTATIAGAHTVTGTDGTATGQATLVVDPAAASQLAFAQAPSSSIAGTAFAPKVRIAVEDQYGNVVTSDDSTQVTVGIDTNPSSGTLSGTATVTASSGVATFNGLSIDKAGLGYTLAASSVPVLVGVTSGPFDIAHAAASSVSLSLAPASVRGNGTDSALATATIVDAFGNAVPGETVSLSTNGDVTFGPVADHADGTYTSLITASTTADDESITATDGSLSDTKNLHEDFLTQTITFNNPGPRTYGDAAFASGATADSGLTVSLATTTPTVCGVSGLDITILGAGSCTIQADQSGNAQYSPASQVSQTFDITSRAVTVTVDPGQTKVYGTADPTLTYQTVGLVSGDSLSGVLARDPGENVGSYAIGQGSLANSNYTITFVPADFAITAAPVTVTADAGQSKVYGAADPTLTYQTVGLVSGDHLSGQLSRVPGENVGSYAIGQGSLANSNYTITFVPADFAITAAPVTVTADAGQSKVYGAADPTLTYHVGGSGRDRHSVGCVGS